MPRIEITEAELAAEYYEAVGEEDAGLTTVDLEALTGWGKGKVLVTMKKLILAAKWERVSVRRQSVLTGVTRPVNAYRPVVSSD